MSTNYSSRIRLNIETYLAGANQPTHPSVIAFDQPWNGYKYWMAYTPFPQAVCEEENPSIAVSNDLLYWDTPKGLLNPIAFNEETGYADVKDPHILYRDDLDRIEVWYLGRLHPNLGGDGKTLLILRKVSYNGIEWSNFEVICESPYLSPSVIWEEGKYKLWGIGYSSAGTKGTLAYMESTDGKEWSEKTLCTIDGQDNGWAVWHGSVSKVKDQYFFAYMDDDYCSKSLYFACSSDGVNFEKCKETIELTKEWFSFYRPFLLYAEDQLHCIYGLIDREQNRYLGYSRGKELSCMKPLDDSDVKAMKPMTDSVPDTSSVRFYLKVLFRELNRLTRIELFILIIPFGLFLLFCNTALARICVLLLSVIISAVYLFRFSARKPYEKVFCCLCGIWQGILVFSVTELILNLLK